MAKDLLATPKGKTIKLSDGKEYTLAPFTLNTLANLEQEFDCDLEELTAKLAKRAATSFRKLLWVLLREDYPDLTLEGVGKLVELNQMNEVVSELTSALEGLNVQET